MPTLRKRHSTGSKLAPVPQPAAGPKPAPPQDAASFEAFTAGRSWFLQEIEPPARDRLAVADATCCPESHQAELRAVLLAAVENGLAATDAHDLQFFALLVEVIRNYTGSSSPAEEFILDALRSYGKCRLDPDKVDQLAESFNNNYSDCIRDATRALGQYPDAFNIPQAWRV